MSSLSAVPYFLKHSKVGYFFVYHFEKDGLCKEILWESGTTVLDEPDPMFGYHIRANHVIQKKFQSMYLSSGMSFSSFGIYVHKVDLEINHLHETVSINYAYLQKTIFAVSPDWERHRGTASCDSVRAHLTEIRDYHNAIQNLNTHFTSKPVVKRQKENEAVDAAPQKREIPTLFEILKNKYAVPTIDKDGFFVTEENWYFTMRNIHKKKNTLFVGDTGCGKTALVMLGAKLAGIPVKKYNFGAMQDALTCLIGQHVLEDGRSAFKYADFFHQIQQPGIKLLDELSRAPANTGNILFPVLDDSRELNVDIAHDLSVVKVHEDAGFAATANVGVQYSGAYQMDRALLDRFMGNICEIKYMDVESEAKVLIKRTDIQTTEADVIAKIAHETRVLKGKDQLSDCVSTRLTLECAELVVDGFPLESAVKNTFKPVFDGDTESGEWSSVLKIIDDHINKSVVPPIYNSTVRNPTVRFTGRGRSRSIT